MDIIPQKRHSSVHARVQKQKYHNTNHTEEQEQKQQEILEAYSVYQLGQPRNSREVPLFGTAEFQEKEEIVHEKKEVRASAIGIGSHSFDPSQRGGSTPITAKIESPRQAIEILPENQSYAQHPEEALSKPEATKEFTISPLQMITMRFAMASFGVFILVSVVSFTGKAFAIKKAADASQEQITQSAQKAITHAKETDIAAFRSELKIIQETLEDLDGEIGTLNSTAVWASQFVPGASKLASGNGMVEVGVDLTSAMDHFAAIGLFSEGVQGTEKLADISLRTEIDRIFTHLRGARENLDSASSSLVTVRAEDLPENVTEFVTVLDGALPQMISSIDSVLAMEETIIQFIGGKEPRKYLLLFQNNQEARATGGFIGSYGIVDFSDGRLKDILIDGIYNPGGQLIDNVVPPLPIQKISEKWSLHDSNWWPDFPKSAETAIDFYERTGGATVDGVVMLTPTMMEKILRVIGPVDMPEYELVLTAENFIELTQQEVEVDYDKEENKPKQILTDLMPIVSQKLMEQLGGAGALEVLSIINEGLAQRHIITYMRDDQLQQFLEDQKWAGRIIDSDGDYLSVVNTNINGFKTDGVIDQKITHDVRIDEGGSVVGTVVIERTHNGGSTGREWWDAVNANYMRVYVPEGSQLISAEGYTREVNEPRLNYRALDFEYNQDVISEEESMVIDPNTGTRIYEESGKTVFANWVYVSPRESVRVKYTYLLPNKVAFVDAEDGLYAPYDVLYQKQSGSTGSVLESKIQTTDAEIGWSSANTITEEGSVVLADFTKDVYHGIVLRK